MIAYPAGIPSRVVGSEPSASLNSNTTTRTLCVEATASATAVLSVIARVEI